MLINKAEKNTNGFTLVELLAVLGIGGAMVAGALLLTSDVANKKEIKQHSENISTMYNNMGTLFTDEDITDDMATLIISGVFPNTLKIDAATDTVKTSGGGTVEMVAWGTDGYVLNYGKIKADACVEVIKNQKQVGWDAYDVTVTGGSADAASGTAFDGAVLSTFAASCDMGTDWVDVSFGIE